MKPNRLVAAAVKAILAATPGIATVHAQQVPVAQQLEDVMVYGKAETYRPEDQTTATGLRMQLVDTPQSISVVSEDMLKIFNEQTAYNAVDLIPGASQGGQAFGLDRIYLRGQLLGDPRINGINTSSSAGTEYLDSFALERVEVVRGPATVLYGVTGAFGGEINQVLKRPQAAFHADVGFKDGDNGFGRRVEADVTGAVPGTDDRLKLRMVAAYTKYGDYQDTVVPLNNINSVYSGAATFDFTDKTSASVYLYKEERSFDPHDGCPLAQTASGTLYIPTAIQPENLYCNNPSDSHATFTQEVEQATLSHTFANDWNFLATATHTNTVRTSDYVFGFGPAGAYGLSPQDVYLYSYQDRYQQNGGTADVSLGGKFELLQRTQQFFVALEHQEQNQNRYNYGSTALGIMNMFTDGGKGILANGNPIPATPGPVYVGDKIGDTVATRASAQLLLNPIGRLNVLLGELVDHTNLSSENVRPGKATLGDAFTQTHALSRVGITYGLVAEKGPWLTDAKPYFNYSQGFLPNIGVFDALGEPLITPQREKSYELGLKTQWIDGHLDAYVAAYHSTDTNLPTTNYGQVGTSGGTFSSVLGGTNSYDGVEVELLGEILPGWNADLSYSHIKAEQDSLILNRKIAVANVPRDQVSLSTSYEFIVGPLKGLLVGGSVVSKNDVPLVGADTAIASGHYDPSNQVPWSGTRFDFVARYKDFAGFAKGLEISANVYNAFNSRSYFSPEGPGQPGFGNTDGPPRTVTVGVHYKF